MNIATIRNISRLGWAVLASAAAVFAVLFLSATVSGAQIVSGNSGGSGSTGPAIANRRCQQHRLFGCRLGLNVRLRRHGGSCEPDHRDLRRRKRG